MKKADFWEPCMFTAECFCREKEGLRKTKKQGGEKKRLLGLFGQ